MPATCPQPSGPMPTQCKPLSFRFQGCQCRRETPRSSPAGRSRRTPEPCRSGRWGASSDSLDRVPACFSDHRGPRLGIQTCRPCWCSASPALPWATRDLNDHDGPRHDPQSARGSPQGLCAAGRQRTRPRRSRPHSLLACGPHGTIEHREILTIRDSALPNILTPYDPNCGIQKGVTPLPVDVVFDNRALLGACKYYLVYQADLGNECSACSASVTESVQPRVGPNDICNSMFNCLIAYADKQSRLMFPNSTLRGCVG